MKTSRWLIIVVVVAVFVGTVSFLYGRFGGDPDAAAVAMLDTTQQDVTGDSAAFVERRVDDRAAWQNMLERDQRARAGAVVAASFSSKIDQLAAAAETALVTADSLRSVIRTIRQLHVVETAGYQAVVREVAAQRDTARSRWAAADSAARATLGHLVEARDREARFVNASRRPQITAGLVAAIEGVQDTTRLLAGIGIKAQKGDWELRADYYPEQRTRFRVEARYSFRLDLPGPL